MSHQLQKIQGQTVHRIATVRQTEETNIYSYTDIKTKKHKQRDKAKQTETQRARKKLRQRDESKKNVPLRQKDDNIHEKIKQKNTRKYYTNIFCNLQFFLSGHIFHVYALYVYGKNIKKRRHFWQKSVILKEVSKTFSIKFSAHSCITEKKKQKVSDLRTDKVNHITTFAV